MYSTLFNKHDDDCYDRMFYSTSTSTECISSKETSSDELCSNLGHHCCYKSQLHQHKDILNNNRLCDCEI